MSMFFMIIGNGKYDRNGNSWDEGVTTFAKPFHRTKAEAIESCGHNVNLDKSTCPLVQEVNKVEQNGRRQVTFLVKAMGYQQAEERVKDFCKAKYKPRKTPRNKQFTAKEYFERKPAADKPRNKNAKEIFEALPRAMARMKNSFGGFDFEYLTDENRRTNERLQSGRTGKHVSSSRNIKNG